MMAATIIGTYDGRGTIGFWETILIPLMIAFHLYILKLVSKQDYFKRKKVSVSEDLGSSQVRSPTENPPESTIVGGMELVRGQGIERRSILSVLLVFSDSVAFWFPYYRDISLFASLSLLPCYGSFQMSTLPFLMSPLDIFVRAFSWKVDSLGKMVYSFENSPCSEQNCTVQPYETISF